MLRCTSPGRTPSHHIVERWPTGYETWVCRTSFGRDVVPDVKYKRLRSEALPGSLGVYAVGAFSDSANETQPGTCSPTPIRRMDLGSSSTVSYTHLRAHETRHDLVCRL